MISETKNDVLIIPLKDSVVGEHVNGPILQLIQSQLAEGTKKVLFNMTEMRFIDSTGLGMLLSAASKIRAAGGTLVFCNVPDQLKKLLKMTKLENAFNQQADEAAALSFFEKQ